MKAALLKTGAVGFALVALTGACSNSSSSPTGSGSGTGPSATMQIGSDTANNKGSQDVSGSSSTSIQADNFFFNPTVLTGSAGQKLKIEITNASPSTTHNFSIDDQNISQDINPNGKVSVTVTFPKSGFVEFYCRFHRSSGMVGELTTG